MSSVPDELNSERLQLRDIEKLLQPTDAGTGRTNAEVLVHELGNLLTIIIGYSEVLLASLDSDDFARGGLEEIRTAAKQSSSLAWQLLALSRKATAGSTCLTSE